MKKAGYASGKCEGADCEITMVGDDSPPGSDTAEVVKSQLEELGFKVNLQKATHDVMYTKFCWVPENTPDACPNFGWLKDFNDGQSMLDPTFNGENILPENNSNAPLLDDPAINKAIDKAKLIDDPQERDQAWGDIDTPGDGAGPGRSPTSGTTRRTSSPPTSPAWSTSSTPTGTSRSPR